MPCPIAQGVSASMPKAEDGGGIVIMMPDAVVFHTTSREDDALTTAFHPIVVTKSKNKLKFDSHMIFFGLAEVWGVVFARTIGLPSPSAPCSGCSLTLHTHTACFALAARLHWHAAAY